MAEVTLQIRIKNTRAAFLAARIALLSRFVVGRERAWRFALWAAKKVARTEIVMPARVPS